MQRLLFSWKVLYVDRQQLFGLVTSRGCGITAMCNSTLLFFALGALDIPALFAGCVKGHSLCRQRECVCLCLLCAA